MKVNFAALQQAHGDLGKGVAALEQKLTDLDRKARPMVDTWSGAAQQSYYAHQEAWTKAANELKVILTDIQKALADSLHEYVSTEQANTKLFH